ncbi:transcription initiation factor TFIID subunit 14 [Coniella lustricola]|uniref:Transcription initiation factor TFIID subunit 14 n=1 Tax=Coniella lustricola TaxID=2025994 RepID=A0A2T3AEP3_9PEZI|nr:transcription initiation factor TFIID subunit 14 [Coniella lustricola]
MIVERTIKLVTEQNILEGKASGVEGFPMRKWNVKIYILDAQGNQHQADCFTKVVFNLHPSFENPQQTFTEPPFKCENEGWGEFEMHIDLFYTDKSGKISIPHDLNFQRNRYEDTHVVTFKNPSQSLQQILRETGPLPNDEDRRNRKAEGGVKKQKKPFDVEKMADAMVKLEEDDLLHVIQLIHDHKADDTYIQNNIDAGEFSVDLYTLPDNLGKMIWDYLVKHNLVDV